MSDFSDKCRFYLQESGSNVYQIAQNANLDRTTVQRMLTGKRLPSQEFVKTFCSYLRINHREREDLLESYTLEKIGKTTYQNRKYVQSLLKHISQTNSEQTSSSSPIKNTFSQSNTLIYNALEKIFNSQDNTITIRTNLPASYEFFFYVLNQLHVEFKKSIPVKHVFNIHPNPLSIPESTVNLEKLYYIIPFLFSDYTHYYPVYYYSRNLDIDFFVQLFPFYLITDQEVILLSPDLRTGMVHKDAETIHQYTTAFDQTAAVATPLVTGISDPKTAMMHYADFAQNYGMPTYSLEAQPCIHAYFSNPNQFSKLCPDELPEKDYLVAACKESYSIYYDQMEHHHSICTLDGIRRFAQTGKLSGALTIYAPPFSATERKRMLSYFLKLLKTTNAFYVTNDTFTLPEHIQIEVYGKKLVCIIYTDDTSFNFITCTESSICEAFYDFADSITESACMADYEQIEAELKNKN